MAASEKVGEAMTIECGVEASKHFTFDDGYINFNHGSYGAVPDTIRARQRLLQDASQTRPDIFIRHEQAKLVLAARNALASHLGLQHRRDVVLVPNASTGLNVVLHNLAYECGDVALYFSITYSGIIAALRYLSETTPLEMREVQLVHPLGDDAVLDCFLGAVADVRAHGKRVKLAVLDTIASQPGIRCPFERLVAVCRQEGILSCVDAAHGVGQIPLELTALDPDFLVSNLHKWLYVPRGCAILYVARRNQHLIRSNFPTSFYFVSREQQQQQQKQQLLEVEDQKEVSGREDELSDFEKAFEFWGTLDITAYLVVTDAIAWRARMTWNDLRGEEAICAYLQDQARSAGHLVAVLLGTEVLENDSKTLGRCAFANVRLPLEYSMLVGDSNAQRMLDLESVSVAVMMFLSKTLITEHNAFLAVVFHAGCWWTRLSAQVYLTLEDWRKAANLLKDVCDRARARRW